MAEMVPVTITGVVRGTEDGSARRERFFIELAAAAEGDPRRLRGRGSVTRRRRRWRPPCGARSFPGR